VREAQARPMIPHRSGDFERLYAACSDRLGEIFGASGAVLMLTGSGTAGVESAMLSLIEPGGTVITCASGKFGERWQQSAEQIAKPLKLNHVRVNKAWGEPIEPGDLEPALRDHPDASVVCLVHSETSTATVNDVWALASAIRASAPNAMIVVDAVSSIAAMPFHLDDWGVDAAITGSQKALGLPPGLAFVALSRRAIDRLKNTASSTPMYLDLRMYQAAHEKQATPYTPAVSLFYALRESLEMILTEGLEARWTRARRLAEATRQTLRAMGLGLASSSPSDAVTAAWHPPGAGEEIRKDCQERYGVWLAGGQGPWKGRVFRISHMGYVTERDTLAGLQAVADALRASGAISPADAQRGLAAAKDRLAATRAGQSG